MIEHSITSLATPYTIDPRTHVGAVELRVADLGRSLDFYQHVLGLDVLNHGDDRATLGVDGRPLLRLHVLPGAPPVPLRATGLYHFALLLPTPADLGHALRRMIAADIEVGQGDHLVSEALYISDPDGNGIEVYRDRPRDQWTYRDGLVQMATDPVDLRALLLAAERDTASATAMPAGTTMGHIHLKIDDIAQARVFFVDTLGFEVMAEMPSALFISAGGYHHHLGLNTWHSRGAAPNPADAAGLIAYTVVLPDTAARDATLARLDAATIPYTSEGDDIAVRDPWNNRMVLVVEPTR
jgi:catechol 2,3-dioxygenase